MKLRKIMLISATSFVLASCGAQGPQGLQGEKGEPGVGITNIIKTNTDGLIDTYTITFSDGTTTTFQITNGADGEQGIQGEPGSDGHSPVVTIGDNGNWFIDGVDSGISAQNNNSNNVKYHVTFHLNGGFVSNDFINTIEVNKGECIKLPEPHLTGYKFIGWYTSNSTKDKKFTSFDQVSCDMDLYAQYEIDSFTLTLDFNGGYSESGSVLNYKYGDFYNLPKDVLKEGSRFVGWTYNGELIDFEGVYMYEDVTFVAKFEENYTFKIHLNPNGGNFNGSTEISVQALKEYTLPIDGITKDNYAFAGWYNGTKKWDFEGIYELNCDIWLAAKWETPEDITITIDTNGGNIVGNKIFNITNEEIYKGYNLPVPFKENYNFIGYFLYDRQITNSNGKVYEDYEPINLTEFEVVAGYVGINNDYVGDYLYFGSYPQREVNDFILRTKLSSILPDQDGYIKYNDKKYLKTSVPGRNNYNDEKTYYFEFDPILWHIENDGTLFSNKILDSLTYYSSTDERSEYGLCINNSNYKYSEIRAFLNGYDGSNYLVENYTERGFIDIAFDDSERSKIMDTIVDNSLQEEASYECEDTTDRLYLFSAEEYTKRFNSEALFYASQQYTDYANYKGITDGYTYIWLRTPVNSYSVYSGAYGNMTRSNGTANSLGIAPLLKVNAL